MPVDRASFGVTPHGEDVNVFSCTNRNGLSVELINYGATVKSLALPATDGPVEVTLGFPDLAGYLQRHPYFGSTVGRFANRIAGGRFEIDGRLHRLATNNGPNHLHGGIVGFDRAVWDAESIDGVGVRFVHISPDGDEGYPGTLRAEVTYELGDDDTLTMRFRATADAPTPVNLTNHTYWNLAGQGTILEHEIEIAADHYLPVDAEQIPTGEIAPVADTAMDFTVRKPAGRDLADVPGDRVGYDHCYVLRHRSKLAFAARVHEPGSGRTMEVLTTQPGLQFYTGNNLTGFEPHGGFPRFAGLCLEAQHFPDSPNQAHFPSTILSPGETLDHITVHRFFFG